MTAIHKTRPELRIIGTGGAGSADQLLSQGLAQILDKPWRIDELAAALRG